MDNHFCGPFREAWNLGLYHHTSKLGLGIPREPPIRGFCQTGKSPSEAPQSNEWGDLCPDLRAIYKTNPISELYPKVMPKTPSAESSFTPTHRGAIPRVMPNKNPASRGHPYEAAIPRGGAKHSCLRAIPTKQSFSATYLNVQLFRLSL